MINKILEELEKDNKDILNFIAKEYPYRNRDRHIISSVKQSLQSLEAEHQKAIKQCNDVSEFLVESHAFDIKELKEKHQKEIKQIRDECVGKELEMIKGKSAGNLLNANRMGYNLKRQEIKEIFNNYLK